MLNSTVNQSETNAPVSIELLKALALCQHEGQDYFVVNGKAYEGEEKDFQARYKKVQSAYESFSDYMSNEGDEIEETDSDGEKGKYMILTDSEADEKAGNYIKDSLWAFNASFLAEQTGLDSEIFEAIAANDKCEDNNDTIYNTIEKLGNIETFIQDAIRADGRGHFMSSYDGRENEETVYIDDETGKTLSSNDSAAQTFFIYRIN